MDVLNVKNLTVSFGGTLALDSVNFKAQKGEVVALLGSNGAGKTTIINTLLGHIKPLSGKIEVFGLNPLKNRKRLCNRWTVMPQQGRLPQGLKTKEVLQLFTKLHGTPQTADDLLKQVEIEDIANKYTHELSSGEQQQVSLAVALTGNRDLLLLDEPTAGLDISSRLNLLRIVKKQAEYGATVLITTHIFGDAENIAETVLILEKGQVINTSTMEDLQQTQPHILFTTKPGLPIENIAQDLHRWGQEVSSGQYIIHGRADKDTLAILTSWLSLHNAELENLTVGTRSLKEVVFDTTTKSKQEKLTHE